MTHCVGHFALKKLLGVEAEAFARAGAARAACPLRGLHPAGREQGGRVRGTSASGWEGAQGQARREGGRAARRWQRHHAQRLSLQCKLQCKAHPVTQSAEAAPADGCDTQAVHARPRVVLLLLHHPTVHHVHHSIHYNAWVCVSMRCTGQQDPHSRGAQALPSSTPGLPRLQTSHLPTAGVSTHSWHPTSGNPKRTCNRSFRNVGGHDAAAYARRGGCKHTSLWSRGGGGVSAGCWGQRQLDVYSLRLQPARTVDRAGAGEADTCTTKSSAISTVPLSTTSQQAPACISGGSAA